MTTKKQDVPKRKRGRPTKQETIDETKRQQELEMILPMTKEEEEIIKKMTKEEIKYCREYVNTGNGAESIRRAYGNKIENPRMKAFQLNKLESIKTYTNYLYNQRRLTIEQEDKETVLQLKYHKEMLIEKIEIANRENKNKELVMLLNTFYNLHGFTNPDNKNYNILNGINNKKTQDITKIGEQVNNILNIINELE